MTTHMNSQWRTVVPKLWFCIKRFHENGASLLYLVQAYAYAVGLGYCKKYPLEIDGPHNFHDITWIRRVMPILRYVPPHQQHGPSSSFAEPLAALSSVGYPGYLEVPDFTTMAREAEAAITLLGALEPRWESYLHNSYLLDA